MAITINNADVSNIIIDGNIVQSVYVGADLIYTSEFNEFVYYNDVRGRFERAVVVDYRINANGTGSVIVALPSITANIRYANTIDLLAVDVLTSIQSCITYEHTIQQNSSISYISDYIIGFRNNTLSRLDFIGVGELNARFTSALSSTITFVPSYNLLSTFNNLRTLESLFFRGIGLMQEPVGYGTEILSQVSNIAFRYSDNNLATQPTMPFVELRYGV